MRLQVRCIGHASHPISPLGSQAHRDPGDDPMFVAELGTIVFATHLPQVQQLYSVFDGPYSLSESYQIKPLRLMRIMRIMMAHHPNIANAQVIITFGTERAKAFHPRFSQTEQVAHQTGFFAKPELIKNSWN